MNFIAAIACGHAPVRYARHRARVPGSTRYSEAALITAAASVGALKVASLVVMWGSSRPVNSWRAKRSASVSWASGSFACAGSCKSTSAGAPSRCFEAMCPSSCARVKATGAGYWESFPSSIANRPCCRDDHCMHPLGLQWKHPQMNNWNADTPAEIKK